MRRDENGTIVIEGDSPTEDAELLLQLLQATPQAVLDWTQCGHIHTAVLQIVLAAQPTFTGPCGDPWVRAVATTRPSVESRRPALFWPLASRVVPIGHRPLYIPFTPKTRRQVRGKSLTCSTKCSL